MSKAETINTECKCGNTIIVRSRHEPGGLKNYGGVIVQCEACNSKSDIYVGRDFATARVISGGRFVGDWDRDLPGDHEAALARHGLA
jgi:hypothetical protein